MPTRRILEVSVIAALLLHPIMGLARLWAMKTMRTHAPGDVPHGVAEVVAVVA